MGIREADNKWRRIGLRHRLAAALHRDEIHTGLTDCIGRNHRLELAATDEFCLQLFAIEQCLVEWPESLAPESLAFDVANDFENMV